MITVESPSSERSRARAWFSTPSGSLAPEPRASLCSGTPNSISPPTPRSTASVAARTRESIVCWTTPGIELIGRFSLAPSRTNIGSTRSAGRRACSRTRERIAADVRSRRGRSAGARAGGRGADCETDADDDIGDADDEDDADDADDADDEDDDDEDDADGEAVTRTPSNGMGAGCGRPRPAGRHGRGRHCLASRPAR